MTKVVELRSAHVPHDRIVANTEGPSMTRQEFADECDVNMLMARYEKTGVFPFPDGNASPRYLDLSDIPDFQTAMQVMIDANAAFMSLPATVRREFDNDPAKFVDYASDPEHLEQLREWGLAPPAPAVEPPAKVEIVNPEALAPASLEPSKGLLKPTQ